VLTKPAWEMTEAEDTAHVPKLTTGALDVESRADDEVSARLRSFDLRRHRTQTRTLKGGAVLAAVLTVLLVVAALYARGRAQADDLSAPAATDA